jgi:hypothetical protein
MALKELKAIEMMEKLAEGTIIKPSLTQFNGGWLALFNTKEGKRLASVSTKDFEVASKWKTLKTSEDDQNKVFLMELNPNNAAIVRHIISWARPSACGSSGMSIGITDSSTLNIPQEIKSFEGKQVKPVIVKYPENPSDETPRNLLVAIDTATWGVLESGYKEGYGVIASGIKENDDVVKCLLYGYSMISIDCSDKINLDIEKLSDEEVEAKYNELEEGFREAMTKSYLENDFKLGTQTLHYTPEILRRAVLEYGEAIMFAQNIYTTYLNNTPWDIDFEVSLVKEGKIISPHEHFLVGFELTRNKIKVASIEVDGSNIDAIKTDLIMHAAIADNCKYRLTIKNADSLMADYDNVKKTLGSKGFLKLNDSNVN